MDSSLLPSLISGFIKNLKNQGRSQFTIVAYKKDLEQFIGFLASQQISDIRDVKKESIEAFINNLFKKGYTKKSASRKLNSIRTFFKYLRKEGVISTNPSLDVSHPKYSQLPPRVLTKIEYRALRDFAKENKRTYALIEILLQTGIKISELANIRLNDINHDGLTIRGLGKNPNRTVDFNKAAQRAVKQYLKERKITNHNDFLFITRTGNPLLIRNIRQIIARCFHEVGIKNATVNDLRNTFIAHQLKNGASAEYISRTVGYKRLSSTERFLNTIQKQTNKKEKLGEL